MKPHILALRTSMDRVRPSAPAPFDPAQVDERIARGLRGLLRAFVPAGVTAPIARTVRRLVSRTARPRVPASTVQALLSALHSRDAETARHCSRVWRFAELFAAELALQDAEQREHLRAACLLHDLGKLHVPLHVLHKPGRLDDGEWAIMRAHAPDGERLVAAALSGPVARIVGQHHERMDGGGYPAGLAGAAICLEAKIVAVADAYDAMTSDRPYRRAMPPSAALDELRRASGLDGSAGGQFDPVIVRALEQRLGSTTATRAR